MFAKNKGIEQSYDTDYMYVFGIVSSMFVMVST